MTLDKLHQILKESDAYLLRVRVALAEGEDECMGEECGEDHDDDDDEDEEADDEEKDEE